MLFATKIRAKVYRIQPRIGPASKPWTPTRLRLLNACPVGESRTVRKKFFSRLNSCPTLCQPFGTCLPPTNPWFKIGFCKPIVWIKAADSELEPAQRLPHSWTVTSDSIAAWVAIRIRASQVILLKSCQVPKATIPELSRLGIVDSHLPALNLNQYRVQFSCEYLHRSGGSHHETVTPNH